MRIIFLDIDGVMNQLYGSWDRQFKRDEPQNTFVIDPDNVQRLHYIMASIPDAKIVMSSTWALYDDQMQYAFLRIAGLKDRLHTDWITPRKMTSTRGQEISLWLDDHKDEVTDWVVLEDSWDAWLEKNELNVVHTNPLVGLTWTDAEKAIRILK